MKKLLGIVVLGLLISTNLFSHEQDLEKLNLKDLPKEEKKIILDQLWNEAMGEADPDMLYVPFNKFKFLADNGHVKAQYLVCLLYREGKHVKFDSDNIVKYCQLAADQGHEKAKIFIEAYKASKTFENKKPTAEIFTSTYIIGGIFIVGIIMIIIRIFIENKKKID